MSATIHTAEIPLSDAALRIGKGYQTALNMLLRGDLIGRRNERGRWVVTLASVERHAA